ncbi:MAG TPA: SPOR domain-containing protein [Candidatus Eisenbacteria bacterium]|nr:SPOR domain-containing protein [Candidatus Eisenbacteria bacterium]
MTTRSAEVERYADPNAFAREVNLPLLGTAALPPVPAAASLSQLLAASTRGGLDAIVDGLAQTRQSLTLRSLLLAGFPNDPECFALGLALGRAWSRRGLKVAVVDLDGWNPTVVRPPGEPGEGFVDVLEYGCSFQRVAWEIVAGSLWLVGPGTHPSEESRLSDHPDWDRAARVFAARADVTLYVAPFLHKPGLTGRLSKRMDAAILLASVERVGRSELRDAFLELWGSDAPIIGCVALEPVAGLVQPAGPAAAVPTPREAAPAAPAARAEHDPFRPIALPSYAPEPEALVPQEPSLEPDRAERYRAPAPTAPAAAPAPAEEEASLLSALEEEVRSGAVTRRRRRRGGAGSGVWIGAAAVVAIAAGAVAWFAFIQPYRDALLVSESLTTGEEAVEAAPPETAAPAGTVPQAAAETPPAGTPAQRTPPAAAPPSAKAPATTPPAAKPPVTAALSGAAAGIPLTAGPPADGKPFRVHVASFRSEAKVAPIVRDLRLKGADAWFEQATDAPGWYRVFVGRFATQEEAAAYAAWLLQNKWVDRAHAYPSTSR